MYGVHSNNGTKQTPSLSADIFGDWREEVVYPTNDNSFLRIYTTTIPTEHMLTTLMHDTQYRCAVAWQNVGYNQPPHPSFYIGDDKTEYSVEAVELASVPEISSDAETDEVEYKEIISRESFTAPAEDWQGEIVTVSAPYKEVFSPGDGWKKSIDAKADSGIYRLELLWKPTSDSDEIRILNENDENIITITKSAGAMTYTPGNKETKIVNSTLTKNDWYSIALNIDVRSRLIDGEIKNYSTVGAKTIRLSGISFNGTDAARIGAIETVGACMIDNFRLAEAVYNSPIRLVTFRTSQPYTRIMINGKTVTSDGDGVAYITLRDNAEYDVTAVKADYRTYKSKITLSGADIEENITLSEGEERNVYIRYINEQGETLKKSVLGGTVMDNNVFTVPDEKLSDLEYNGAVYEFNPNLTDKITVVTDEDTYIDLIYTKKKTPVYGDAGVLRVNLGENGFGREAVSSPAAEYGESDSGIKYGMFRNIGDDKIEISLPDNLEDSYIIEFDMLIENIENENAFSMTPCNDDKLGNSVSFAAEDNLITLNDFEYASEDYKNEGYVKNQLFRVVIVGNNGEARLSLINRDSGKVYIDEQVYNAGVSGINKLVFGREQGGGEVSVGLAEIKAYTIGGATQATYSYGNAINMTIPMQISAAPVTVKHCTDFGNAVIDLTEGLSYSITGGNECVSIDEITGQISVREGAEIGKYTVNIMYNGHIFRKVPLNIVKGTYEKIWTEDFESEVPKFKLVYPANSIAEFHRTDPSKNNKTDGLIYGVGARNGGNTGANSTEIATDGYTDIAVEMDFKIDATAYNNTSYIALLGGENKNDSLSSDKQILAIRAFAGGGNGYWSSITINGESILSQIDTEGNTNGETAGAGYSNGGISFGVLNRDTTGWLHLRVVPDFERQKINVVITRKINGELMYSGELDFLNEVSELKHIFVSGGRQYGTAWLDNIVVNGINPNGTNEPAITEPITNKIQNALFGKTDDLITGSVTAIITLKDITQEQKTSVFAAIYDDEKLLCVKKRDISLLNGENKIEFNDFVIEGADINKIQVSVFVWNDMEAAASADKINVSISER